MKTLQISLRKIKTDEFLWKTANLGIIFSTKGLSNDNIQTFLKETCYETSHSIVYENNVRYLQLNRKVYESNAESLAEIYMHKLLQIAPHAEQVIFVNCMPDRPKRKRSRNRGFFIEMLTDSEIKARIKSKLSVR